MSNQKTAVYSLGERIRKAREDMNWHQSDLAEGVKKKRATIAGWENNKHRPSALELDFIAELTGYPIRVPNTLPRPVPADYLPSILASATPDVRLMIALAAYAGLRCAEIAAIDATDIDLTSHVLAVRCGKGGKDRIVPVHPDLAAMLHGLHPGPLVDVTAQRVGKKVAAHLRSLGIEATCHKLRHTFGTELARATEGNIVLVATLMGHGDVSTSMRYVGWAGGPGADAIAEMYHHG